jgi:hypothetical protein
MPVSSIGDIPSVDLHSEPAPRVSARLRALNPIDTLKYVGSEDNQGNGKRPMRRQGARCNRVVLSLSVVMLRRLWSEVQALYSNEMTSKVRSTLYL